MPRRCPKLGSNVATSSPARCSGKFPKGGARGSHAELAPRHCCTPLPHVLPLCRAPTPPTERPSSPGPRSLTPLSLGPLSRPLSRLRADAAVAGSWQSVVQLRPPPAATTSQAMARRSTWLAAALPLTAGAACACRTHLRCRPFFIIAGAGGLEPLLFVVQPFQATSVQAVPLLGCARAPSCPRACADGNRPCRARRLL